VEHVFAEPGNRGATRRLELRNRIEQRAVRPRQSGLRSNTSCGGTALFYTGEPVASALTLRSRLDSKDNEAHDRGSGSPGHLPVPARAI
jgi:hypothetical protein